MGIPEQEPERTADPPRGPADFAAFYERHFDAVLGFVTRRTTDPHLAADLTADIFVAALQSATSYDPRRGTALAWLYGIARNVLAVHARGNTRENSALARLNGHRQLEPEDIAALEERIDAERAARDLAEHHAALSEPLRAALDLVAVDGLTTEQAAQVLGVSQTTIRVRLHRARRILRASRTTPVAVNEPTWETAP